MIKAEKVYKSYFVNNDEGNIINLNKSNKMYKNQVLTNINFTVSEGETVGIFGPSGVGKTTLLNILMGIDTPDSGCVQGISDKTAAVFQEDCLIEDIGAVSNIRLVCDKTEDFIKQELLSIIPDLDVHMPVRKLSGGMKRRVCIVRAFITDAEVVFLDEPFKGLDEVNKRITIDYVNTHKRDRTCFVVSHNMEELNMLGVNKILHLRRDLS